jgi:hypothetical protein
MIARFPLQPQGQQRLGARILRSDDNGSGACGHARHSRNRHRIPPLVPCLFYTTTRQHASRKGSPGVGRTRPRKDQYDGRPPSRVPSRHGPVPSTGAALFPTAGPLRERKYGAPSGSSSIFWEFATIGRKCALRLILQSAFVQTQPQRLCPFDLLP